MSLTITQLNKFESIHNKLIKIIPDLKQLQPGDNRKSKVNGFMDLHFDVLQREKDYLVIALAHYYEQNGDLMKDPDMEIKVYLDKKMPYAEALNFSQDGPLQIYQEVYFEKDGQKMVYPKLKKQLNTFLNTWLRNIINQGHDLAKKGDIIKIGENE